MRARRSEPPVIEFKGTALRVMSVQLRSGDADRVAPALTKLLGPTPDFFSGEAAIFDCAGLGGESTVQWAALIDLLRGYGLAPVGVRGCSDEAARGAREAGLVLLPVQEAASRGGSAPEVIPEPEPKREPAGEPVPAPAPSTALVVDRPLRSGQQIYARGGDLVVLAMVNTGAEVIADGNIHIYAPLRGRALAGARGNGEARIFTTCMEAELVSIAGVYRTFEQGPPPEVARRPAQVRLRQDGGPQHATLSIEPLATN